MIRDAVSQVLAALAARNPFRRRSKRNEAVKSNRGPQARLALLASCLFVLSWTSAPQPVRPAAAPICPKEPKPHVVEIREANPDTNRQHHDNMILRLADSIPIANTTILLGPDVVLDFGLVSPSVLPLRVGPCVTLKSVRGFGPDTVQPVPSGPSVGGGAGAASPGILAAAPNLGGTAFDERRQSARTPHSPGPLLKFGPHRTGKNTGVFLLIACDPDVQPAKDNVHISGFRLYGPSFGQQSVADIGIQVKRCLNIEISNMEIAGWGEIGIQVIDDADRIDGPGQEQPENRAGDRIGRPEQVRIFGNYIHHNQHPRTLFDSHAAGYGVELHTGAWAQIYENVFDSNRHAIAASNDTGGYEALRNLVLKGGGVHWDSLGIHTHQFDIHGSEGSDYKGGRAGVQFLFAENSFQYLAGEAVFVRGTPLREVRIRDNVFAHEGLEKDEGDDAINLYYHSDLGKTIFIGPNNVIDFDSYGQYGVCDFDGDRIDDLFLATGKTWWFSSSGEFPWTYLSARIERLSQVRLGYFDADNRCDVLTESDGQWVIASGGTGPWQSIGAFGAPLSEVAFGQFDPNITDHRPGATKRTTHAFRSTPSGDWLITPLSAPAWQRVGSSRFPLSKLSFGDFTGDGVTDVLAVEDGRWAISVSARTPWQRLNDSLSDKVESLFIADLNNNNTDDLIRLERKSGTVGTEVWTWWISDDGRAPWRKLQSYKLFSAGSVPVFAYGGRFGVAPGGGVLLIDHSRIGHFYSPAEIAAGASPDWANRSAY